MQSPASLISLIGYLPAAVAAPLKNYCLQRNEIPNATIQIGLAQSGSPDGVVDYPELVGVVDNLLNGTYHLANCAGINFDEVRSLLSKYNGEVVKLEGVKANLPPDFDVIEQSFKQAIEWLNHSSAVTLGFIGGGIILAVVITFLAIKYRSCFNACQNYNRM